MCELILDNNIIYNFCIHNITPRAFKFNDNNDAYENASTFLEEKHKFFLFQLWLFFLVFKNDNVKLFDK